MEMEKSIDVWIDRWVVRQTDEHIKGFSDK